MSKEKNKNVVMSSMTVDPITYVNARIKLESEKYFQDPKKNIENFDKILTEVKKGSKELNIVETAFLINTSISKVLLTNKAMDTKLEVSIYLPSVEEGVTESWTSYVDLAIAFLIKKGLIDKYLDV